MEGSDNNINKNRVMRKMRKTIIIIQLKENYNNMLNNRVRSRMLIYHIWRKMIIKLLIME